MGDNAASKFGIDERAGKLSNNISKVVGKRKFLNWIL